MPVNNMVKKNVNQTKRKEVARFFIETFGSEEVLKFFFMFYTSSP
jgi:hypothetical protein